MGVRRSLCGAAALVLLAACGDPAAVGSDESTPDQVTTPVESVGSTDVPSTDGATIEPVSMNGIEICTQPDFGIPGTANPAEDQLLAVSTIINARPDLFAGMWWEGSAGGYVFTTVDAAQATDLLEQNLPPDVAYRLVLVTRNASQLAEVQSRGSELVDHGFEVAAYPRVWDALVEVDLAILDQPTVDAVRDVFGADVDAICVTGADPATMPPDGPQPSGGDGWRLLADQDGRGQAYSMHVAVNDAEYRSLWESLALDGDRPPVDFASEIVIHFGATYGGNCPEIRLDDVDIDLDRSLVTADIVLLGGNRMCNEDSHPRAYLVAVDRTRLPPVPFTVGLDPDCTNCTAVDVRSIDGTESHVAALSEFDRSEILAAVAVARIGIEFTGYQTVEIVDVIGQASWDGFIDLRKGSPLTESERIAITHALGSRTVRYVPASTFDTIPPGDGYAILSFAEPVVTNGQLTVTSALWCGSLCGNGGAYAVERRDDGTWTTTVPVGPQWMS